MTISFSGLASGLDTSSWVESLVALKQAKVTTLQEEKEEVLLSKDTLNSIKAFFSSFRSTIERITDSKFNIVSMDLFAQNLATSADLNVLTASATTEAEEASYQIQVDKLASNTNAISNYKTTVAKTTVATEDSYLKDIGVTTGSIGVTVDGVKYGVAITEKDTIGTFIQKLKDIGVESSYNSVTGVFSANISTSDIDDTISHTGIVEKLHLAGVNEGYKTENKLEIKTVTTEWDPATVATKMKDLGVNAGTLTITANGAEYDVTIDDDTTIGEFVQALKDNGIDADLTDEGIFILADAVISNEGSTNIINAMGLVQDIYSKSQQTGLLLHETIVTETTTATSATLLKDIGTGTAISDGQTVIVKNSNNEYTTIEVGTDTTIGELLAEMSNAGLYAAINSDGTIEISGGTITGGTFDAVSALGLETEPYTAMTTGDPLTETIVEYELVTYDTRLVDDLGVTEGYLQVEDPDGNTFYQKIYSGQTIGDLMADLANNGIYSTLDEENGILEITGGAFATLTDADVQALIANNTIAETDARYQKGTNLLECLYGAPAIATGQIAVASAYSRTQVLTKHITTIVDATLDTTLGTLGLSANGTAIFDARGESKTINVTTGMTVQGLMDALAEQGIESSWDADFSRITINNTTITGGSSNLADVLNLSTTIAGKYVTSDALSSETTITVDATGETTFAELGVTGNQQVVLVKEDGTYYTFNVDGTTSMQTFLNTLNSNGVTAKIEDGYFEIDGGYIVNTAIEEALGLEHAVLGYSQILGNKLTHTIITTATGDSTVGDIITALGTTSAVAGGYDMYFNSTALNVDANTTIDDLLVQIYAKGGTSSIDSAGRLHIDGGTLSGTVATALGFSSVTTTDSVSATGEILTTITTVNADTTTKLSALGLGASTVTIKATDGTEVGTITTNADMTIGDFFSALAGFGISGTIKDGVITLVSDDDRFATGGIIGSLGIGTTDRTYTTTAGVVNTSTGTIISTFSITANSSTTLGDLNLGLSTITVQGVDGVAVGTITTNADMTIGDVLTALAGYGISGTIKDGVINLNSDIGNYATGGVLTSMGVGTTQVTFTTTAGVTNTSSSAVTLTTSVTADYSTTLGKIGGGDEELFVYDSSGAVIGTITTPSSATLEEFFADLAYYGIHGRISDGVISLSSDVGNRLQDAGYIDEWGIGITTVTETTTISGTYSSDSAVTYSVTADTSTTLGQLGVDTSHAEQILSNGILAGEIYLSDDMTIGDVFAAWAAYGIVGTMENGVINAESTGDCFIGYSCLGIDQSGAEVSVTVGASTSSTIAVRYSVTADTSTTLGQLGVDTSHAEQILSNGILAGEIYLSDDMTIGDVFAAWAAYGIVGTMENGVVTAESTGDCFISYSCLGIDQSSTVLVTTTAGTTATGAIRNWKSVTTTTTFTTVTHTIITTSTVVMTDPVIGTQTLTITTTSTVGGSSSVPVIADENTKLGDLGISDYGWGIAFYNNDGSLSHTIGYGATTSIYSLNADSTLQDFIDVVGTVTSNAVVGSLNNGVLSFTDTNGETGYYQVVIGPLAEALGIGVTVTTGTTTGTTVTATSTSPITRVTVTSSGSNSLLNTNATIDTATGYISGGDSTGMFVAISTAAEINYIFEHSYAQNYSDVTFVLTKDITLYYQDGSNPHDLANWNLVSVNIDGQGHTLQIDNSYFQATDSAGLGLFYEMNNVSLTNMNLEIFTSVNTESTNFAWIAPLATCAIACSFENCNIISNFEMGQDNGIDDVSGLFGNVSADCNFYNVAINIGFAGAVSEILNLSGVTNSGDFVGNNVYVNVGYDDLNTSDFVLIRNYSPISTDGYSSDGSNLYYQESTQLSFINNGSASSIFQNWDELSGGFSASGLPTSHWSSNALQGGPGIDFGYLTASTSTTSTVTATMSSTISDFGLTAGNHITISSIGTDGALTAVATISISSTMTFNGLNSALSSYGTVSITNGTVAFAAKTGYRLDISSSAVSAMHLNSTYAQNSSTVSGGGASNTASGAIVYYEDVSTTSTYTVTATLTVENTTTQPVTITVLGTATYSTTTYSISTTTTNVTGLDESVTIEQIAATYSGPLNNMTISIHSNGTNYAVNVEANDTIGDVFDMLTGYGIACSINGGAITLVGNENSYITSMGGDIMYALGFNSNEQFYSTSTYTSHKDSDTSGTLTYGRTAGTDTTLGDLGLDRINFHVRNANGYNAAYLFNSNDSITDINSVLSAYDMAFTIIRGDVWLDNLGSYYITGADSLWSALNIDIDATYTVKTVTTSTTDISDEITYVKTLTHDTTFADLGLDDGIEYYVSDENGVGHDFSLSAENTWGDLIAHLASYGIHTRIENGKFYGDGGSSAWAVMNIDAEEVLNIYNYEFYTTTEHTTTVNTASSAQGYRTTNTMSTDDTFGELGLSADGTITLTSDGILRTVTVRTTDTLDDMLTQLASHGITGFIEGGKLTLIGDNEAFINSVSSGLNTFLKLGTTNYTTSTHTTTGNTNSNQQGYSTTNTLSTDDTLATHGLTSEGTITVVSDGTQHVVTVKTSDTIDDMLTTLASLGIKGYVNGGKLSLEGDNEAFVLGVSSNLNTVLKLGATNYTTTTHTVTSNTASNQQKEVITEAADGLTQLQFLRHEDGSVVSGYQFILSTTSDAGNQLITIDFSATDTVHDVIDKLAEYGLNAYIDSTGRFAVNSSSLTDFDISGTLGTFMMGSYTKLYDEGRTSSVSTNLIQQTIVNMDDDTQLSKLNITSGNITLYKDGSEYTLAIDNSITVGDFRNMLSEYGINSEIIDGRLQLTADGVVYLKTPTGGSNLVTIMGLDHADWDLGDYTQKSEYLTDTQTIVHSATMDDKLSELTDAAGNDLGVTAGQIYVYQDGTRNVVNIDTNDTLQDLSNKLSQYGITMDISSDGKVYFNGNNNSFMTTDGIASGSASNILTKFNVLNNWITRYDSTSETLDYEVESDVLADGDTKLSDLQDADGNNLGITEGNYYVYQNGVRSTESISADTTLNDFRATMALYGMTTDFDQSGSMSVGGYNETYLATSATGGYDTNAIAVLFEQWDFVNVYTSNNLEIPQDVIVSMSESTKLSDINEGTYQAGYITVVKDGVQTDIELTADDTVGDLMDELALYGFESVINANGQLIIKNTGNSLLQNYVGAGTASNALTLLGIDLNSWITTNAYESGTVSVTTTTPKDISSDRDTLLSEMGVTTGEYYLWKDGVKYTSWISSDETLGSFMDTLKGYGIETSLVDTGAGSVLSIEGSGNSYLETSASTNNASNVVDILFTAPSDENYKYEALQQTSRDVTTYSNATEETLLSYYDEGLLKAEGELSVTVDGVTSAIQISADETIGSLLGKFKALGMEATLADGHIVVQSGYKDFTINTDGTSSNALATLNMVFKDDLGGYIASDSEVEQTVDVDLNLSVSNYAGYDTAMKLLNIADGTLTLYRDGEKATLNIDSEQTFGDLRAQISSNFSDVDIKFEDGYLTFFSTTDGVSVEVGATTDTSNFSAITGITSSGNGTVKSARELYCVNGSSVITTSGLFRNGDVKEGSFFIGDAEFNITDTTTLSSLISQINASESANATAYWDSVDGKFVIKSRTTGAALVNIEAGTSNFTDVMGFTKSEWADADGDGNQDIGESLATVTKMNVAAQEIGDNARFSINGTYYTSTSNTVGSDVSRIKGVTINLKGISEGSTTLTIERDKETVANAVSDIVDAYNELIENVDKEIAKGGTLDDQFSLKLIRNQIRSLMTSSIGGNGVFKNLDAVGISLNAATAGDIRTDNINILNFDKDKFLKAFDADRDALKDLLVGTDSNLGIFQRVENVVESAVVSSSGYFASAEKGYNTQISRLDNKIKKAQEAVERYRERLEAKFASMDLLIANMQNQYSSFLG